MTLLPWIFFGVGLLLILIEFFLPGAIMGIAGGILLALSIVLFAKESSSWLWTLLFVAIVIIALGLLIKYTLRWLRKGRSGGIFLHTDQEGYVASFFDKELIGKKAEALTDLKPSGHILVEGKRYQAVAKTGYLEKGSLLEVVGGEGAHLIVKGLEHDAR